MDFTQAVEHAGEDAADETLGHVALMFLDVFLQRPAMLVFHDHVDGFVGTEEIEHSNYVRVGQAGQGSPLFEETLHAVAEGPKVVGADNRLDVSLAAQCQTVRP